MELLFQLLLLPLAHATIRFYMQRFRSKVKKDDVVGIEVLDDVVLNRTVYIRLEHSVLALDYAARTYREYPLSKVFTRDMKALPDISGDLQNLF